MHISSEESGDGMTVVLPVFRGVPFRSRSQRSGSNEYVGIEYDSSDGNHTHNHVHEKHILEFDILPSEEINSRKVI